MNRLILNNSGRIFSVHNNAFYFFLGNELYLVHEQKYGVIPFGIAIDGKINFKDITLKKDMQLYYNNFTLEIPEADLAITLEVSTNIQVEACEHTQKISRLKTESNVSFASEYALTKGSITGLDGLFNIIDKLFLNEDSQEYNFNFFEQQCFNHLSVLVKSIIKMDFKLIKDSFSHLIGLGIGLTPSMDDVLVGLLSTLFYIKNIFPDKFCFVSTLGKNLYLECKGRTTLVSETYLKYASKGENYEFISDTVWAILFSTKDVLKERINLMLSIGSDSGKGMLLGIILGLRIFLKLFDNLRLNY
ncbi:MAG: DUF2877 domain-containing protein [Atribacterota bacterium]|nr:DUF2877 domain-containing protein [Atribacterota bacterium]